MYGTLLREGVDKNPFGGSPNNVLGVNIRTHTFILPRLMMLWSTIWMSGVWQCIWYPKFLIPSTNLVQLIIRMGY